MAHFSFPPSSHNAKSVKLEQHSKQLRALVTAHRPLWKIGLGPNFQKSQMDQQNTSANAGLLLTG